MQLRERTEDDGTSYVEGVDGDICAVTAVCGAEVAAERATPFFGARRKNRKGREGEACIAAVVLRIESWECICVDATHAAFARVTTLLR